MVAPVYEIRTISDFAKIPGDRLPVCLAEFVAFLMQLAASRECQEAGMFLDSFQWKDDGIKALEGIELELLGPDGEVLQREFVPNPGFPSAGEVA